MSMSVTHDNCIYIFVLSSQDRLIYVVETNSPKISVAENNKRLFSSYCTSRSMSTVLGREKEGT